MTPFARVFRIGCLSLGCLLPVCAHAGFVDFLFPKRDIEVITVTDATKVGALRRQPSPANPIYYFAVNSGFRDFGGIIAGDKIPKDADVNRTIVKVLAKQGLLPATNEHLPSVVLLWTWGTMNVDREMTMDGSEGQQRNRGQLLRFLGGYKLGMISKDPHAWDPMPFSPELMRVDSDSSMLNDLASEDLYVVAIGAFDYAGLQRKEKILLWTTKISCPAIGLTLADTLPTMLAIAGPNIGRETARPVWMKATDKYKPEVRIGEAVVVPDSEPLPVIDAPRAKLEPRANPGTKSKRNR